MKKLDTRAECYQFIRSLEEEVLQKSGQARSALLLGSDLTEIQEYYPYGRDAWNKKAEWLDANGPYYLSTSVWGSRAVPFPEAMTEAARHLFALLAGKHNGGIGRGRDMVHAGAQQEEAKVFPRVQRDLNKLRNFCRNEIGSAEPKGSFNVLRMPPTWEEFLEMR